MQHIISVSELNRYLKELLSRDFLLSNLMVKGEISNYKYHYSGHMYFTLKDQGGLLKCVMFRTNNQKLKFTPENGMKVIVKGYISIFERDGQYQLYAQDMQPDGIGSLHLAFEQRKQKLKAEGLFEDTNKKKLPFLPRSIGVVTSLTGSVLRDIFHVLQRRFENIQLKIYPVAVQGEQAPYQISRAIEKLNQLACVDVIIVARGGGSLEELWAFNEEIVARSIFASDIPVISAVGHETDYTIADFVADVRAPTPSAAAEIVVPEKEMMYNRIFNLRTRLSSSLYRKVDSSRARYEKLLKSSALKQPYDAIYQERMKLDVLNKYLYKALLVNKEQSKHRLGMLVAKLDTLSPLKVMARGYSVVRAKEEGAIIKTVVQVSPGDEVQIDVKDGSFECTVKQINKKD